jgi:hypothetical protein
MVVAPTSTEENDSLLSFSWKHWYIDKTYWKTSLSDQFLSIITSLSTNPCSMRLAFSGGRTTLSALESGNNITSFDLNISSLFRGRLFSKPLVYGAVAVRLCALAD